LPINKAHTNFCDFILVNPDKILTKNDGVNGKVIINDGYFTNEGATANVDPAHFDLIYASGNAKVEINGGEFKCQTPKWTLNIKDKDRKTASIVVKGGKFHGFNPADCLTEGEGTNFVAEGYKVVEENGVFTVMPE
jgi:hypothetical protein